MADTLKRMYIGQPSTGGGTIYTAPSGTGAVAVVRTIHVTNTTASAATITLSLVSSGTTHRLITAFSVPANGILLENVNIVMEGSETLTASQGTSTALTMVISGVEL